MPDKITVLILENDEELAAVMADYLQEHDIVALATNTVAEFDAEFKTNHVDLILLDIMLDGASGLGVCRTIRDTSDIPIIFVTALGEESDIVLGLELGADDYIVKPFSSRELLARIKRVLYRTQGRCKVQPESDEPHSSLIRFGDWILDTNAHLLLDEEDLSYHLSKSQYLILKHFLDHRGKLQTRDALLAILDTDLFDESTQHRLDVHVSKLRSLLRSRSDLEYIRTIRGVGYLFTAELRPEREN
ncbi:MAG: response regulator transcription factor [Mailhella sp.]|nr:response regulator transcription factor [Mailhella sp.]